MTENSIGSEKIEKTVKGKTLKEYMREYRHRPDVKAKRKEYLQRHAEEIKAKHREYCQIHAEEIKARQKEYNQRPEIKAKRREYNHRPDVKAKKRECNRGYYQRPDVKERRRVYYKEYNQRPDVKAKQRVNKVGNVDNIKKICLDHDLSDEIASVIAMDGEVLDKKMRERGIL